MKLHLETSDDTYQIQRYDQQSITINETVYTRSLIIMPHHLSTWEITHFDHLEQNHFEKLCQLQPQVALIGTGTQLRFPALALLAPLVERRIGIEVMDTQAACRTYMLLMAEGRAVAAALLLEC